MRYRRMPIEEESPEQLGYGRIRRNLAESSVSDASLGGPGRRPRRPRAPVRRPPGPAGAARGDRRGRARAPSADDVLVTPGAVAALFIIHTSLLEPGDHLVVARPNYATNVETPRAIGADVTYLDLAFEDGWAVDPARIAALMTPRTRLVSLTTPHNPTGTTLDEATLREVIALVERRGARLLLDETYREMTFGEPLPVAASLSPSVISRQQPVQDVRPARDPDRLARDPRPGAARPVPGRQGADPHQRLARRRDDRPPALRRRPAWLPRSARASTRRSR